MRTVESMDFLDYVPGRRGKDSGPMIALFLFILALSGGFARAQSPAPSIFSRVTFGATLEGYDQHNWNEPCDRVIPLRAYDTRSNSFSILQASPASCGGSATRKAAGNRHGDR